MSTAGGTARGAAAPRVSFEFFPPKTEAQASALEDTVRRLGRLRPSYVSVTYGAGGSMQDRSFGTVSRMRELSLPTAAHITCAGASRDALAGTIDRFLALGIKRFVALRGDPPGGLAEPYRPHADGYTDTAGLVAALKRAGADDVSVSAYPERHPQSPDWATEIDVLKRKVDAGADRAITQFFFDNDLFEAYLERVRRVGIDLPVVPGIMPIHRFQAVQDFSGRCGATIPRAIARRFEGLDPETQAHRDMAIEVACEQMDDLIGRGADAFHIYTLNRAELTEAACRGIGVISADKRAACAA